MSSYTAYSLHPGSLGVGSIMQGEPWIGEEQEKGSFFFWQPLSLLSEILLSWASKHLGVLQDESPEGKNLLHGLSCLEIFLYNHSLPA